MMSASTLSPIPQPHFYGSHETVFEVTLHEPDTTRPVPEALVQDIWRTHRYDSAPLATSDGQSITVLDPGRLNTDQGPDFLQARLRIGDVEWTGDVEIHTTSGGWFDHNHHTDPAYNNVILHVALHADIWTGGLLRADGTALPEAILFPVLDTPLRALLYQFYTQPPDALLCAASWTQVPASDRTTWIETLAEERVQEKKDRLAAAYLHTPDLDVLLYERLLAALGYAKNDEAMTELARRIPLAFARSFTDPLDLEALYLGVSGLLPAPADLLDSDRATADYVMDLHDRFAKIRLAHALPVMDRLAWRFFRLRPANFPPLRIAQAVALLQPGGLLHTDPVGRLLNAAATEDAVADLRKTIGATPGPFWQTHIRLEKTTPPRDPSIGRTRIDALIANAVVPLLLLHAEQTSTPDLEATAFSILRTLPPARDEVTRRFMALGTRPHDAFVTQGLHQLYRTRCCEARCLACPIGHHIMDRTSAPVR